MTNRPEVKVYTKAQKAQLHADIDKYFDRVSVPLVIHRYQEGRNEGQQAKVHCLIREIAKAAGCGEEWLKTQLKHNFWGTDMEGKFPYWPHTFETDLRGKSAMVPISESKLTKREESELIEGLYAFGAEWGVEFVEAA